ncbi:MAG: VCBS repeat-containing protein, partial [Myxococcales bacterium]|nr:VCBS repeat-containing protein [Myxococcales bacterium]
MSSRAPSRPVARAGGIVCLALPIPATPHPQTAVSDDRVALPGGPGSLGGVPENVALTGNMGTMRYAVPIEVPTGFPGMTPDVSLSYDSGRGGGVIAYAWDLPAPSIERNTVRGLPRYDADDEFVTSDGAQLVRVADDPPTYRARFERGFERFTWLDAGDGGGGYWRVELPDGRVEWYGATPDGSIVDAARVASADGARVFRYHLVERRDPFGHRLTYDYSKSGLNVLLQRIGWVYTDAAEPTFSVTVQHEPRADDTGGAEVSDARGGFDVRITTRVAAINVFARGERIRRYALSYRPYADTGGFTHLRRVETFGHRDGRLPIVHDFEYTEGLGPGCGAGECLRPFVVEMGRTGLDLSSGRGTFIDINGDGLPDLLHTPLDEPHQFYLAIPAADGSSRFAAQPVISAFGANFLLDNGYVQVFDANGDGFADLVNARSGEVLFNRGEGDWDRLGALTDVAPLPDFAADLGDGFGFGEDQLQTIRFLDFDSDKRIDVLRSTRQDTTVYRNLGPAGFAAVGGVEPLGRGIAEDGVEFADMNGDGLLDPVWVRPDAITYRVHLGRGRWGAEVAVPIALEADAVPFASLQDLNGDGLSDLLVVRGRTIQYAANQAGDTFVDFAPLGPGDVDGDLPERREGVQVLYADMNANGSTDVVWVDRQGTVTYLDLFPVRPNLISRITNGLGQTIDVEYETSVQQVARSAEAWPYPLPFSMQVVRRLDVWDAHGDVHDVTEASYRDGFYDGVERQFRGYGVVERRMLGDASREEGLEQTVWDLGVDDVYRHGLPVERTLRSDDRLLWSEAMTYADCPLDGVPAPDGLERPVRFTCLDGRERRVVEGGAEADAVTLATTYAYDGYGNPTVVHALGDVDAEGDEWRVETTFAAPA